MCDAINANLANVNCVSEYVFLPKYPIAAYTMDIKVVTIKTYAKKECKFAKRDIKLFITF
jgi:hypothetical protein